ncbi:hypothetical protein FOVSG1_000970 [Fusarium oxysporum f. sp. vasinfectum]
MARNSDSEAPSKKSNADRKAMFLASGMSEDKKTEDGGEKEKKIRLCKNPPAKVATSGHFHLFAQDNGRNGCFDPPPGLHVSALYLL